MYDKLTTKQQVTSIKIILVFVTFIVFYPIIYNDFLYQWDDKWMVMNHYTEGGLTFQNLILIFFENHNGQYSPINELYYMLIYSLFGYNASIYHFASIIIHSANVLLVFTILNKICIKCCNRNNIFHCFFVAAIFAIHPLNVESVAWISASKVILYVLFYLTSTLMYMLFLENRHIRYYIFSLLLFVLSLGCKEQAVTFPVWLILLNWIYDINLKKEYRIWLSVIPFFLGALLFGILTLYIESLYDYGLLSSQITYPLWQRVAFGSYSIMEYIFKSLYPYKLSYMYPYPSQTGEAIPFWLLIYPMIIVLLTTSLWSLLKRQIVKYCLLFFIIHILIVLHIIPLSRSSIIADRYIYIAMIGLTYLWIHLVTVLYNKFVKYQRLILILGIGYLLLIGIMSHSRSKDWHDSVRLKKETEKVAYD